MSQQYHERSDMSQWLIHFVHRREGFAGTEIPYPRPLGFADDGTPIPIDLIRLSHEIRTLPPASSFEVLKDIVHDGYVRAGWAFRREGKATVYGPSSVVCFTEMPLNALLTYKKNRGNTSLVDDYGIAILKAEAFGAGARPVIYGLSTDKKESEQSDPFCLRHYRELAAECGLGRREQYRYVHTNLRDPGRESDWIHEREWRWPCRVADKDHPVVSYRDAGGTVHSAPVPGLPLWLLQPRWVFSRIILIVQTNEEAEEVLGVLKMYCDGPTRSLAFQRKRKVLKSTSVLSLQDLPQSRRAAPLRIEDLSEKWVSLPAPVPSSGMEDTVREAVSAAVVSATSATCTTPAPLERDDWELGCVVTYSANTKATVALLKLNYAQAVGGLCYILTCLCTQLGIKDVLGMKYMALEAAIAAAEALTRRLGQPFYVLKPPELSSDISGFIEGQR